MYPLQQILFTRRIFILATGSFASLVIIGMFAYNVRSPLLANFMNPLPVARASSVADSAAGTMPAGVAASFSVPAQVTNSEMHIANSGLVLLRDARVVAISGNTLEVKMMFGADSFMWSVQTNSSTKFPTADGGEGTFAAIHVGDVVTATGMLVRDGSAPVISAEYLRE